MLKLAVESFFSKSYALFISHAWDYESDYQGAVRLLNADNSFRWENISVTRDRPLPPWSELRPRSFRSIVHQLDAKIKNADCVLVLAGMYVAQAGWIHSEIDSAKDFNKPVIAIAPRGQERFPRALIEDAEALVGWNSKSIIDVIRRLTSLPAALSFPDLFALPPAAPEDLLPPRANFFPSLLGRYLDPDPSLSTLLPAMNPPQQGASLATALTRFLVNPAPPPVSSNPALFAAPVAARPPVTALPQNGSLGEVLTAILLSTPTEASPLLPLMRYRRP